MGWRGASWIEEVMRDTAGSPPFEFQLSMMSSLAVRAVRSLRMQDAVNGVDQALGTSRKSGSDCRG